MASLPGCSGAEVPETGPRVKSFALEQPESTPLGKSVARASGMNQGASGFELLTSGRDAFQAIVALVRLSRKTLDLQYYIWRANRTGRLLMAEVIAAADRGVRVRLLLDDMDIAWEDDELRKLSAHPNIEICIFNPFENRDAGLLDILFDFQRITHRMHNKAFIADNSVAVIGGRNVGDRYFSVDDQSNYRDLDLYVAGPIVREASRTFDRFWNSEWSIPIAYIDEDGNGDGAVSALQATLREAVAFGDTPYDLVQDIDAARDLVDARFERLIWTESARLLADRPNKAKTKRSHVLTKMEAMLDVSLQHELLLEMAYLIPGEKGLEWLCGLVDEGIKVRVLTNSFLSNDVLTAYAGYRKYREDLVACGVEIFEMRPHAEFVKRDWNWLKPTSAANLHTKAAVIDGELVLIGSFNLDPRSIRLNTEIALAVRNERLAGQVRKFITDGMKPDNAYRLKAVDGDLVWVGEVKDGKRLKRTEPGIASWRGFITILLSTLPNESQL
ncbi:MAG: phospholipase D family protein [Alphaproteobacteria bacterium]